MRRLLMPRALSAAITAATAASTFTSPAFAYLAIRALRLLTITLSSIAISLVLPLDPRCHPLGCHIAPCVRPPLRHDQLNQLAYAHQRTFIKTGVTRTCANPFPQANRVARYFISIAKNMASPRPESTTFLSGPGVS